MVKALIVQPDGTKEHRDIEANRLGALQNVVGGYVEYVFVTHGVHCYVNEEGKIIGLDPNPEATRLAGYAGVDILCGPVVFLGDGPDGDEGDLPPEWQEVGR